jgi:tetratricopeptide (TPR) repeat protein
VENNPSDLKKKYELAKRLFDAKQYPKAIPLLQQAVANPTMKSDVLVLLGECFVRDGKLDLARRQLEKALDGLSAQDRPDAFKTAHYLLGRIYEKPARRSRLNITTAKSWPSTMSTKMCSNAWKKCRERPKAASGIESWQIAVGRLKKKSRADQVIRTAFL